MLNIRGLIKEFFNDKFSPADVYNEFSFQHEFGIFLRNELKSYGNYKVQFERNISDFISKESSGNSSTIKKEIDIVIFNENEKYAIELKFPRNGQYPEQMYSFIKDIKFMEEVKSNCSDFDKNFCVTLVDNALFYDSQKKYEEDSIYRFFRTFNQENIKKIKGEIYKPTGKGKENKPIKLNNEYAIEWFSVGNDIENKFKYYILEIV